MPNKMRNLVMNLVMFSILINLAVGIMIAAIPAFDGMDARVGLDNDNLQNASYMQTNVYDQFNNVVDANPTGQDLNSLSANTLVDRTALGMLTNLWETINKFMFGFIDVLYSIFGGFVPEIIFSGIKGILGILYGIAMYEIISGRQILGD
jgi:hypothetical protein